MSEPSELLADYPVVISRDVSWGDMDAFQHVNNVRYFEFFEDARIALFEALQMYEPGAGFGGVGPILAETSCKFKTPLTYPDTVLVGARVADIGEDRFLVEYAVASESLGRIAAEGDSDVVSFDYTDGHKVDIPPAWRDAIDALHT